MTNFEREEFKYLFKEAVSEVFDFVRDMLVTRSQAADLIGVTPRTISNYAKWGVLTPFYVGNNAHYKLPEVLSLRRLKRAS